VMRLAAAVCAGLGLACIAARLGWAGALGGALFLLLPNVPTDLGYGWAEGPLLLGIGLVNSASPVWPGWLTIGVDVAFLAGYLRFKDIPPFVFYVLLLVVGLAVI